MFDEFQNKFAKESKKMNIFFSSADSLLEKPYFCVRFTEMKELKEYTIQISSLKNGVHAFDFQIDNTFFEHFEASPIDKGDVRVDFYFDKQDSMYVLIFEINGKVSVECDRCLEEFELPIKSSNTLIAKFNESEADDADLIHIPKSAIEVNIAEFIYEFIVLTIPMMKKHEDAEEECPEDFFEYLEKEEDDTQEETPNNNPFLDALKNFKSEN